MREGERDGQRVCERKSQRKSQREREREREREKEKKWSIDGDRKQASYRDIKDYSNREDHERKKGR